jgi:hypothetical protein
MGKLMNAKLKLLGLVMAAPVVLASCRAKDPTVIHASPEVVHQALCNAIQAKDWQKMADCWTPESRDMMARDLAATAAFGLFDVPQSDVQGLFKRHGLDDVERKGPKVFDDVDKVAFLAEMWALLEKTGDHDGPMPGIVGSTLANLKVEDGKATGDLVTTQDGKEHRQRIEFHQIAGRWFVHLIRNHNGITDQAVSGSRMDGTTARVWPRVAVGLSLVVGMVGFVMGAGAIRVVRDGRFRRCVRT